MSAKTNDTTLLKVDKEFCKSPEYFKAVATTHRFMRDVLIKDNKKVSISSKSAMTDLINTYKNDSNKLYSILRVAIVTAMNIDIQYVDLDSKETNICNKLYKFLNDELPNNISMIDAVYKLYDIAIPVSAMPVVEMPVVEMPVVKASLTVLNPNPRRRNAAHMLPTRSSRAPR